MRKIKKVAVIIFSAILSLNLFSCKENKSTMLNKNKPVIFYNRQPSDPITGKLDYSAVSWNSRTYYLGTDSQNGGETQGQQILDFLQNSNAEEIDRNGDGIIGYVLLIGDEGHIDSKARTEGVRRALDTWNNSTKPNIKKEGTVKIGNKSYKTVELAAKSMTGADGSTWNAATARESMKIWTNSFGKSIDLVISNNDEMALACLSSENFPKGLPVFGFDANDSVEKAIASGAITGTVTQNTDSQALALLFLVRNMCDGLLDAAVYTQGFSYGDKYGNKISTPFAYNEESRSLLVSNTAINKENWQEYKKTAHSSTITKTQGSKVKLLLTVYNSNNDFLNENFIPSINYYAPLLNIDVTIIYGDGQNENSCLSKFTNLSYYDAYAINLVKTNNAHLYTDKLILQ